MTAIVILIALGIYLMPSIIAFSRGHRNALAICVLNVAAGWTFLGYLGSLVWSLTDA